MFHKTKAYLVHVLTGLGIFLSFFSIISILSENKAISLNNLTAAGRSEYAPVESNDTAIGKAKNRRIEVVLTPKLDEISKLLNGN